MTTPRGPIARAGRSDRRNAERRTDRRPEPGETPRNSIQFSPDDFSPVATWNPAASEYAPTMTAADGRQR